MQLKNKNVLVLGLGDTGLSVLRWLASLPLQNQPAKLSVADTRLGIDTNKIKAELPNLVIHLGDYQTALFKQADLIVISPGVPQSTAAVQAAKKAGVKVLGDVELFAQFRPKSSKVIAITGTNGKTTVTSLVGEMCRAAALKTIVAGNIGLPVLDTLRMPSPAVYILELSSYQLETTSSLQADVATVLNISQDHLDRYHGSETEYAAAKERIFTGCNYQVLNYDDAFSLAMADTQKKKVFISLSVPKAQNQYGVMVEDNQTWLCQGNTKLINRAELKLVGSHNVLNVLAAIALCHGIGLQTGQFIDAVAAFKGLPHRMGLVAEIDGVTYIDDSKGTNVGSTVAALSGLTQSNLNQKVVLILGGDGKGQDFTPLAQLVSQYARVVVLIGRDGRLIADALSETDIPQYYAADLPEAVTIAHKFARSGDFVLLSPACASFDMFKNYIQRAEVFVSAVKGLRTEAVF